MRRRSNGQAAYGATTRNSAMSLKSAVLIVQSAASWQTAHAAIAMSISLSSDAPARRRFAPRHRLRPAQTRLRRPRGRVPPVPRVPARGGVLAATRRAPAKGAGCVLRVQAPLGRRRRIVESPTMRRSGRTYRAGSLGIARSASAAPVFARSVRNQRDLALDGAGSAFWNARNQFVKDREQADALVLGKAIGTRRVFRTPPRERRRSWAWRGALPSGRCGRRSLNPG